jgi:hypothetical protein
MSTPQQAAPAKSTARSEVLMTIATGLAAIAAVGSAVAAFRQEKATFTTNLYSKQVDSVSSMLTELLRLGFTLVTLNDQVSDSPDHKGSDPHSVDLSSPEIKELEALNITVYSKITLNANVAIMPDSVLNEVGSAFEDLLDVIKLLPTAFGPGSTQEGLRRYQQKTDVYFCDVSRIRFCTSEQFQEGMTLRDKAFTACVSKYKSSHKSGCR